MKRQGFLHVHSGVFLAVTLLGECLSTDLAHERFYAIMNEHVSLNMIGRREHLAALRALDLPSLTQVGINVILVLVFGEQCLVAELTLVFRPAVIVVGCDMLLQNCVRLERGGTKMTHV